MYWSASGGSSQISVMRFKLPPDGMTAMRYWDARPRTPALIGATSTKRTCPPGIVPPEVATTTSLIFVSREKTPSTVWVGGLNLTLIRRVAVPVGPATITSVRTGAGEAANLPPTERGV